MRRAGQMLIVLIVGIFCLTGNVRAQQSRAATNANVAGRVPHSHLATRPQKTQDRESSTTTVALIGAVQKPGIYVASQADTTIGQLLRSAGGPTTESNGTLRIYVDGQSQKVEQLDRVQKAPLIDSQVIYVAPRGGAFSRTLTLTNVPYRPVVLTGLGITPLVLNLGDKSQDVEGLVLMLGQSPEVMGHNQFSAVCPQWQWLTPNDLLRPNTIVHFPPETVSHEGVRRAIENGLTFERPMVIGVPTESEPVQRAPIAPEPPAVRQATPAPAPPAKLPVPATTSELVPGSIDSQIEPAASSEPSHEPLRLPKYEDSEGQPADTGVSAPTAQPSRPPIMMRPEWSTFGEETGDAVDEGRKIERTSAGKFRNDQDIVLVAAEVSVNGESELAELEAVPTASATGHSRGIESWAAISVALGIAVLSALMTAVFNRKGRGGGIHTHLQTESTADEQLQPVTELQEADEDRRFLQRLILNQVPLVEEDPKLPEIDQLHGMVIGGRRMIVHEAHDGVPGPHFAVRGPNDTRPLERRLRTVLREAATGPRQAEAAKASESAHVRTVTVSPLERALRTVERGGQR